MKSQYNITPNALDVMVNDGELYILYIDHIGVHNSTTGEFIKQIELVKLGHQSESPLNIKKIIPALKRLPLAKKYLTSPWPQPACGL